MTQTGESADEDAGRHGLSFVHISDPHMTSLASVPWSALLNKRLLSYISWRRKRRAEFRPEVLAALMRSLEQHAHDQLLITGDLTHIALPQEFEQASTQLEMMGGPGRVSIVPGNHDALVSLSDALGLARWSAYYASDADAPELGRTAMQGFPSLRVRGPVAFIGLSSAVPTRPLLATGRVGAAQRRHFAGLLRWAGARGLFRVVMIHHPPLPGLEKWRKRLVDARQVQQLIAQHGAELVLHGHCHKPEEHQITGPSGQPIPVLGAPAALSVHADPQRTAQYYLYALAIEAGGWRLKKSDFRYNLETGEFDAGDQGNILLERTVNSA